MLLERNGKLTMWRSKSSRLPGSRVGCEIYVLRLCQTCLSFRLYSHWTSLTRCQTFGVARSYFINVWCLGTIASPLTAIEVIPVLPECLRSFFYKIQARQYRKDRFSFHVASFTDQFMPTCAAVRSGSIFYN